MYCGSPLLGQYGGMYMRYIPIVHISAEREVAVVLSGSVMRCKVKVALLGGRRPLLIFNRRWEDLGQVS
jgi:hypothetical protein